MEPRHNQFDLMKEKKRQQVWRPAKGNVSGAGPQKIILGIPAWLVVAGKSTPFTEEESRLFLCVVNNDYFAQVDLSFISREDIPEVNVDNFRRSCLNADQVIDCLKLVFKDHGMHDYLLRKSDGWQVFRLRLIGYYLLDLAIEYVKWKVCSLGAYLIDNELPPRPKWVPPEDKSHILLGGSMYSYIFGVRRQFLRNKTDPALRLAHSLSQMKKGCPEATKEFVEKKKRKYLEDMQVPKNYPGYTPGTYEEYKRERWIEGCNEHVCNSQNCYEYRFSSGNHDCDNYGKFGFYAHCQWGTCTVEENLFEPIKRCIDDIILRSLSPDDIDIGFQVPSRSSHISYSGMCDRNSGGAFSHIISRAKESFNIDFENKGFTVDCLMNSDFYPSVSSEKVTFCVINEPEWLIANAQSGSLKINPKALPYDKNFTFSSVLFPHFRYSLPSYDSEDIDRWLRRCLEYAESEECIAEPIALAEPLKVRMITKGPPFRYYLCKYIQKVIHKQMRKHEIFQLMGGPVDEILLSRCMGRLSKDEFFASVDYSNATDWINLELTEYVAKGIAKRLGLSERLGKIYLDSVLPHTFVKVKNKDSKYNSVLSHWTDDYIVKIGQQRRGQLMGSPSSFPILCIINAAVTWASRPGDLQPFPLKGGRIMINGDDNLFVTNLAHYERFKRFCEAAGFSLSVGKSYISDKFAVINSTMYSYEPSGKVTIVDICEGTETFEEVFVPKPYVNLGMLYCIGRSVEFGSDQDDDMFKYGVYCHELIRGHSKEIQEKLVARFIRLHLRKLQSFGSLPWFLPRVLGGLGLPATHGYQLSEAQRRLAWCYYRKNFSIEGYGLKASLPYGNKVASDHLWNLVRDEIKDYMIPSEDDKSPLSSCFGNVFFKLFAELECEKLITTKNKEKLDKIKEKSSLFPKFYLRRLGTIMGVRADFFPPGLPVVPEGIHYELSFDSTNARLKLNNLCL